MFILNLNSGTFIIASILLNIILFNGSKSNILLSAAQQKLVSCDVFTDFDVNF